MNIYKSIGKIVRYRFSTSAADIFNKFNEEYYVKNYLNTFNQSGFPQAQLQIGNKTCNLIGVPRQGVQETMLDDMTELLLKDTQKKNFLVQIDPSPYLYAKRQLYKQYHAKVDPIIIDNLFEQLPILPLDTNELKIELPIFDSLNLIKDNNQLNNEQKQELLGYLNGERQGYFQQMFAKLQQTKEKNEEFSQQLQAESDLMANKFADLLQSTILYQDQSNMVDFAELALFQALYMTILKGSAVYLIGLSQIYQRIYGGLIISLPDLKDMFKEICKESIQKENMSLTYFFEFSTMLWRQKGIEYYLLYSINRFLQTQKEKEVTVIVDAVHYDPLRTAILAQKNQYIEDIENSYFVEFSYPQQAKKDTDEQLIEKHAILDCLLEQQIWKEPCINNPFPYLSVNYNKMSKEEQKEIQQLFYTYHTKYYSVIEQLKKQNKQ